MHLAILLTVSVVLAQAGNAEPDAASGSGAPLKVRNNFVTELACLNAAPEKEVTFSNPRAGWVFFSAESPTEPRVFLDADAASLIWRANPAARAYEAMRFLAEGDHRLRLEPAAALALSVRTVPELAYCYYPANPHIAPFGPYDWNFVTRHVLPHVNTLISGGGASAEEFEQWRREGRQWIANASLPGLSSAAAPCADEVFAAWAKNPGLTKPGFGGMIVDEFLDASPEHYRAWTEALQRVLAAPGFQGRTFYAWSGTIFEQKQGMEFCRTIMDRGQRFAWEAYLREDATLKAAERRIDHDLCRDFTQWRKAVPGVEQRMMLTLGYLCAPPESLNVDPGTDYQVYLDLQFQQLANNPIFANLYGLMEYSASYADEESLRFAHKLIRHYCIEGKRERFTDDPYVLPHLKNPDFREGLKKWHVEAAEAGAVAAGSIKDFSWLQGRYPKMKQGDSFCRMKRLDKGPNRVQQTVHALEPGRLYSVKAIAADLRDLAKEQAVALNLELTGVELLSDYDIAYAYPSCYSHESGPYTREHPAWFTLYRKVFRATAKHAELSLSDAACPPGQELAVNFIEVQPFHAP